jgi:hypothetical protein
MVDRKKNIHTDIEDTGRYLHKQSTIYRGYDLLSEARKYEMSYYKCTRESPHLSSQKL